MNWRAVMPPVIAFALVCAMTGMTGYWLTLRSRSQPKKPAGAPAAITPILKEEQIHRVTLSQESFNRLGLEVGTVVVQPMPRSRTYGGEIAIPPGRTVVIAAPLAGILRTRQEALPAGALIRKGQVLFDLLPLLTPEARINVASTMIEAEGQVKTAESQRDAAQIALDRAKRVFENDAGSRRALDEAQAAFNVAVKSLEAAAARRNLLHRIAGEIESGTAGPIAIESPESGVLRLVAAVPGQTVPSGAMLFEIASLDHVWVRVPVYVGDLDEIESSGKVRITDLVGRHDVSGVLAEVAQAPPAANASAATADLIYDLDNRATRYRPGQRVAVAVPLKGKNLELTAPWSAVIHDIHGGEWVYEQVGERSFQRRRVAVRYVVGETAVLDRGAPAGTRIVVRRAMELFGTETGFSK